MKCAVHREGEEGEEGEVCVGVCTLRNCSQFVNCDVAPCGLVVVDIVQRTEFLSFNYTCDITSGLTHCG